MPDPSHRAGPGFHKIPQRFQSPKTRREKGVHPNSASRDNGLARPEGGLEVDRSFRADGRRPAWPARCRGLKRPLKEASHRQGEMISWLVRRNELRRHCLRVKEPEGSRIFGTILTRRTDARTGSQGPGDRRQGPPVRPQELLKCPSREKRRLTGRVKTRNRLALLRKKTGLATGTTHGADPRAPLPH